MRFTQRSLSRVSVRSVSLCLLLLSGLIGWENAVAQEALPPAISIEFGEPPALSDELQMHLNAVGPTIPPTTRARVFLPLIQRSGVGGVAASSEWLTYVNEYRQLAGVPPVSEDATLSANCREHARYMAENNHLTHHQNLSLPWASPAGEICANKGNAWMGPAFSRPIWTVQDTMNGWMGSPGHRLWLIYPTSTTFGYGFYTTANNRAAAGLDVLSRTGMDRDTAYRGWPIRYPAPNQPNIPATAYPITLNWRYFGPAPTISTVSLSTAGGASIPHTVTTTLPVNHKGILITPSQNLPPNTTILVRVTGTYEGQAFTTSWQFTTAAR